MEGLAMPLPGQAAHSRLAPVRLWEPGDIPSSARPAAVLILLYEKEDTLWFPLIRRISAHPGDHHRGQIGLPGGGLSFPEERLEDTASRECAEEIGIDASNVHLLGSLSPLYIAVSNYRVQPFVGLYRGHPRFTKQDSEVEDIHEVCVSGLFDPANRMRCTVSSSRGLRLDVPAIRLGELIVWGATGMILEEFCQLIEPVR
ncbi:MAG: putative Nudix hydrolase NudL [Saprospiraceae bacterium]|nr:putative Nudix hydrolase NudL [Saprospiraceae bacterium]